MITLRLSPSDIEKVRFAYSPLIELTSSFKVLLNPQRHALYQAWVDEAIRTFDRIDFPYMRAVILQHHYIVDFLTPTPTKTILNFEDEIDRVRATPDEIIRRNVEVVMRYDGATPIRRQFIEHPREALECLIEELRFYWNTALAPHWAQMTAILENDVLFRARALALYGVDVTLEGISEALGYHQGILQLDKSPRGKHTTSELAYGGTDFQLKGAGLQLVPSLFSARGDSTKCDIAWQVAPEWLPMLIYEARGLGLWRQQGVAAAAPNELLALVVGASRARLLQTLVEPIHTNELAQRLSLTAGAVSQQLGKLAQAGLIESYRSGSKVYYQLSDRGGRLLEVFEA